MHIRPVLDRQDGGWKKERMDTDMAWRTWGRPTKVLVGAIGAAVSAAAAWHAWMDMTERSQSVVTSMTARCAGLMASRGMERDSAFVAGARLAHDVDRCVIALCTATGILSLAKAVA